MTPDANEVALREWLDKTDWIRKTIQPHELGKHIADVMRDRLTAPPFAHVSDDCQDPGLLWAEIHTLRAAVRGPDGYPSWQAAATAERQRRVAAEAALRDAQQGGAPIDVVLYCPACGLQHIDAPDTNYDPHYEGHMIWDNPPHRSHLCHGCGHTWRPADVATNGAAAVKTKGKADSQFVGAAAPAVPPGEAALAAIAVVGKLVDAEVAKTRLHAEYMGKAMPDDVYERFALLRENVVPARRQEMFAAIRALGAQDPGGDAVLWVSAEQLRNHRDSDHAKAGNYLPCRKTAAGKFTTPLFASQRDARIDVERVTTAIVAMLDADTTHDYQQAADDARLLIASLAAATPPDADALRAEVERLRAIIDTPQANDFLRAVSTEAEHQRQRWHCSHDAGKTPADWFWLIGYLAGKALHAHAAGDPAKAEHHVITTAAACANWHQAMTGKTDMRPGIAAPLESEAS